VLLRTLDLLLKCASQRRQLLSSEDCKLICHDVATRSQMLDLVSCELEIDENCKNRLRKKTERAKRKLTDAVCRSIAAAPHVRSLREAYQFVHRLAE
jgi:hypothetical protein